MNQNRSSDPSVDANLVQRVPRPPHPRERREPLPSQQPKHVAEDPEAARRVAEILRSPSYLEADQDADFLGLEANRGLRLQVDYLKPEQLLRQHGIQDTIVVFGSTRIPEPAAAARLVAVAKSALAADSVNPALLQRLRIAERIQAKSQYYEVARELGQLVGNAGGGCTDDRVVIMTGGGPGMMEAANRGAADVGAHSVGLNITLPSEQYPNPYVTPELCFRFHYFALRKLHLLLRAKALVAFPGGYGTLDELFETLTLVQTRKIKPLPIVLVGESFWRQAVDIDFLIDEGVIDPEDRERFWFAETAAEIWQGIQHWHRLCGEPLCATT